MRAPWRLLNSEVSRNDTFMLFEQFFITFLSSEMISLAFDGDFCTNREEAYQKFRERQVKEAMHGQQFF